MSEPNVRKHKLSGRLNKNTKSKPKYELWVELEVPKDAKRLREDER